MENFPAYLNLLYLLPVTIALFYLLLQVWGDNKRAKMGMRTAFKDKEHFINCTLLCFIPIFNIYLAYIGIKVIVNSLIKSVK